jgi:GNAT superfamily N-acetyltransferase
MRAQKQILKEKSRPKTSTFPQKKSVLRQFKISKLEDRHLPMLVPLITQLGYPCVESELRTRIESILESKDDGFFVALDGHDCVIGYLHTKVFKGLHYDLSAEIVTLVVDENIRGLGVGKELVKSAEKWATQKGFKSCWLFSKTDRQGAHNFYQNIGYVGENTSQRFEKTLLD